MANESSVLLKKFYPTVERNLSMRPKRNDLEKYIISYMDKNSKVLLDSGLNYRLMFNEEDKDIIPQITGIPVERINDELMMAGAINESFVKFKNNPWIWSMVLSIRYFMLNKMEKYMDLVLVYYSLGVYSSLHYKYFRHFLPNENIMDFTINNLSNKYYIKKYGNLINAITVTAKNSHNSYTDLLERGSDEDLIYYASQLQSRLNAFVKGVFRAYDKNRQEGNYFNKEKGSFDEEDYKELDNMSFQIGRLAQKISLSFISSPIMKKNVRLASKINGVDEEVLFKLTDMVRKKERQNIEPLINTILQIYIIDDKHNFNSIRTAKFMMESMKTISRSNTSNERVIWLKKTIDGWLEKYLKMFKDVKVSDKNKYRKALYQYIIIFIQTSGK